VHQTCEAGMGQLGSMRRLFCVEGEVLSQLIFLQGSAVDGHCRVMTEDC
jgi:hypothetical protein